MRPVRRRLAALASALFLLSLPASAGAFDLSNCTVTLTSRGADGSVLGTAAGPGAGGTVEDPIPVEIGGTIEYQGTSGSLVFDDWTWGVSIFFVPTPIGGSGTNDSGGTTTSGSVAVSDVLPVDVAGLVLASGQITDADGDECQGEAWFEFTGEPVGSLGFIVGLGLLVIGALFLFYGLRGALLPALLGGIFGGVGLAALAVVFGILFLGGWTPAVIAVTLTVLSLGASIMARRARGRSELPAPEPTPTPEPTPAPEPEPAPDPIDRFIDEQMDAAGDGPR